MKLSSLVRKIKRLLFGGYLSVEELREQGLTIGENCHIYTDQIDFGHGYLITIGNNVTLATFVRLLTHDGSTKNVLGYSKVGRVDIGDDVFIGAASIVMPNVKIGNRVVIGAGSVVTKDIPDNSVAVGSPARVIGTYDDFVRKNQELQKNVLTQNTHYSQKTDAEKRQMKEELLKTGYGFDI